MLPPSLAIAGGDPGLVLGGGLQACQVLLPEVGVCRIFLRGGGHLVRCPRPRGGHTAISEVDGMSERKEAYRVSRRNSVIGVKE